MSTTAKPIKGILGQLILNAKLNMKSATLNDRQAAHVISTWKSESREIDKHQDSLQTVGYHIERRKDQLPRLIKDTSADLKVAKDNFKVSKDPVIKRKWAKRVVLLTSYNDYLVQSSKTLDATVERVKDAVAESKIVYGHLQARIADAEIYRELNGNLHLVGKALLDARNTPILPEVEFTNLEITLEELDKQVGTTPADRLLLEAQNIINNDKAKSSR